MRSLFSFSKNPKNNLLILLTAAVLLSSCNKQILFTHSETYQSNNAAALQDTGQSRIERILMPDDKIMVSVWDHDDLSVGSLQSVVSLQEEYGKWIMLDAKGEVKLPQIGNIKLQGLTIIEATAVLEKAYSQFVQKPNVTIRVLTNQVTVLGEVKSQGNYIFSSDNIRLVDLIGKAQGFTDYARTKNVQIIRGEKQFKVDLTNSYNVANKEVIIYPGDVVYVPPAGNKGFDRFSSKLIPIASLLTAIALVYSVTSK